MFLFKKFNYEPGEYIVLYQRARGAVSTYEATHLSDDRCVYFKGTKINIVEIAELPDEFRIRGKTDRYEDWISIRNLATAYQWCKPVTSSGVISSIKDFT